MDMPSPAKERWQRKNYQVNTDTIISNQNAKTILENLDEVEVGETDNKRPDYARNGNGVSSSPENIEMEEEHEHEHEELTEESNTVEESEMKKTVHTSYAIENGKNGTLCDSENTATIEHQNKVLVGNSSKSDDYSLQNNGHNNKINLPVESSKKDNFKTNSHVNQDYQLENGAENGYEKGEGDDEDDDSQTESDEESEEEEEEEEEETLIIDRKLRHRPVNTVQELAQEQKQLNRYLIRK